MDENIIQNLIKDVAELKQRLFDTNFDVNFSKTLEVFNSKYSRDRKFRIYLSSNQAITQNVNTKVALDTVTFDIQGNFVSASNRYLAKEDGYYLVIGSVTYQQAPDANALIQSMIYKNNAAVSIYSTNSSIGSGLFTIPIMDIIQLNAGDYIELFTYHNSVGSKNVVAGTNYSYLIVNKL